MSTESKECSWASVGGVRFRDALIGVLVIGAAIASMYAYVFDEPESLRWLGIGDANIETGPMAFAMDDAIHRGEVPLWNPLSFCGTPFAANPAHSLFYPPNLIRSLATSHPTPFRTHAGILVLVACHLLLAGVGTFLFARHQRLSRPASFVAAFAFVLSSPFIYRTLGHWRMMFVASWLPMLLAALAAALDARALRRKIFFALIAALAFGMACLVGAPQMFTTMGFLAAVYCAVYRLLHWPKRADMSGTLSRDASAMAVFVVVGVLIAAAALVPGAELAGFSARTKGDAEHAFARTEERPDWNAFQLLATYSGSATDSGLRFTGAGVLILALCAWLHADRRRMLVHAALFYVALDCSLGPPFPFARLLVAVAPFAMSQPQRAALFACFFLGLLAGFGLDALTTRRDTRAAQWRAAAAAIASGIIVLYTLEGCANPHPFLDVSKAVLVLPAAVAVLGTVASFMSTGRVPKVLLAALVFAEIWTWNTEFIPHYWRGRRAEVPGDVAYLKAERSLWSDNTRGADPHPNWWVYDLRPAMNGYDPLHIARVREVLCAQRLEDESKRHVADKEVLALNQRGHLFLKRSFWLARQYVRGTLPDKGVLFPAATTVFLPDPPAGLAIPEVGRDEVEAEPFSPNVTRERLGEELTPVRDAADAQRLTLDLSRVELTGRHAALRLVVRASGWTQAVPTIRCPSTGEAVPAKAQRIPPVRQRPFVCHIPLPDFPDVAAALEFRCDTPDTEVTVQAALIVQDMDDENERIEVVERTMNSVTVALHALPGPRMLTFVDADYPGWRAYVDDAPAGMLCANDVFKAVAVPEGDHTVRFEFHSARVTAGVLVSLVTLLAMAVWLLVESMRRKRARACDNAQDRLC